MAKILILTGAHLCTAPRPQKEAAALATAGHDVMVRGFWFDPVLVERDCLLLKDAKFGFAPILDFRPQRRFSNLKVRLQGRFAREQYRRFGRFSPALLGYGAKAMLKVAHQARADLTIVHSEAGLWVGNRLLDEGFRVGVDFEDWFSEDLPESARRSRPIAQLKALEKRLIRDCQYCLTTSHAMAEAMAEAYQAPKPTVIYNSFPQAEQDRIDGEIRDRKNLEIPSIHWFSQTIGPGRGLEILFQALPYLSQPAEIYLRGNYPDSSRQWLESLIPQMWRQRVTVCSTVPNAELLSRIAEHDIGLALETNDIRSRDLTVTNKLFQYLQAGLAVVATDTAGQREILSQTSADGHLISDRSPEVLAKVINALVANSEALNLFKKRALEAASHHAWEKSKVSLLKRAKKALYLN